MQGRQGTTLGGMHGIIRLSVGAVLCTEEAHSSSHLAQVIREAIVVVNHHNWPFPG